MYNENRLTKCTSMASECRSESMLEKVDRQLAHYTEKVKELTELKSMLEQDPKMERFINLLYTV